jgi:hypothetical protein
MATRIQLTTADADSDAGALAAVLPQTEADPAEVKEAIHHLTEAEQSALHRIHEAKAHELDLREAESTADAAVSTAPPSPAELL